MSLNTSIISGIDPISKQPMIDPISQNSALPLEIAHQIFKYLKTDLPSSALVCRHWKVLIDDKNFRQMIHPKEAFGSRDWKQYIKVDVGEELSLPRRAYGDLEKYEGLLTFIPEKIKVTNQSGGSKEVCLDNLEIVGKWVQKVIPELETIFNSASWENAIREKRKLEKPHWVWIKKEVIGRGKSYWEQKNLAKIENQKITGARISGLIDTATSVLMEYVKVRSSFIDNHSIEGSQSTFLRINEMTHKMRIQLGFSQLSGIKIFSNFFFLSEAHDAIGVVIARKSFGIDTQVSSKPNLKLTSV